MGVLTDPRQLVPVAWAFAQAAPRARLGYIATFPDEGSPEPELARILDELIPLGLLAGRIAADPDAEPRPRAVAAAIDRGFTAERWDALICGPGSEALHAGHAALARASSTVLVASMSSPEGPTGRSAISEQTIALLDLLLAPVTVALPAGIPSPVGMDLRAGLRAIFKGQEQAEAGALQLQVERPARIARHDWRRARVDLPGYAAAPLPGGSGPEELADDPLFFGAALAAGAALGDLA